MIIIEALHQIMKNQNNELKFVIESGLARIEFPDGFCTQFLASKRHALAIGRGLVGIRISPEEWRVLRKKIVRSRFRWQHVGLEDAIDDFERERSDFEREINFYLREEEEKLQLKKAKKSDQ